MMNVIVHGLLNMGNVNDSISRCFESALSALKMKNSTDGAINVVNQTWLRYQYLLFIIHYALFIE